MTTLWTQCSISATFSQKRGQSKAIFLFRKFQGTLNNTLNKLVLLSLLHPQVNVKLVIREYLWHDCNLFYFAYLCTLTLYSPNLYAKQTHPTPFLWGFFRENNCLVTKQLQNCFIVGLDKIIVKTFCNFKFFVKIHSKPIYVHEINKRSTARFHANLLKKDRPQFLKYKFGLTWNAYCNLLHNSNLEQDKKKRLGYN